MRKGNRIGIVGYNPIITSCVSVHDLVSPINIEYLKPTITEIRTPIQERTYIIERLPDMEEPFIDPNIQVRNHHKHQQTCAKNRKKRRKKRKK